MSYNIKTHTHLFASWAASRAASVINNRFTVEIGQKILSNSKIKGFILNPDSLPNNEDDFNKLHKEWREEIITLAEDLGYSFTHGVSAKLINIYLKSIIICGGYYNHQNSKYIHPPIDSLLLKELASQNFNGKAKFWRESEKLRWSKFNSDEYEKVICEIKNGLNEKPLWEIEKHWKGFQ